MGLADRGGCSGQIGARWADVCADWIATLPGGNSPVPKSDERYLLVERVARFDDVPRIAAIASRRGLQNPDFIFVGDHGGRPVLQAADAKFSVETAKNSQVSCEMLGSLLELGELVTSLIGTVDPSTSVVPGVFLSPDYPLTHVMLQGGHGITRTTVSYDEVVLVPVEADRFFGPMVGAELAVYLRDSDELPIRDEQSMLAGLYYFRIARAIHGVKADAVRPLLGFNDAIDIDQSMLIEEAESRRPSARSAYEMLLAWDAEVDTIRAQRLAVDQMAGMPLMTRNVRTLIEQAARGRVGDPPSANQVRRRAGAWFRSELRERVGPVSPPVQDLDQTLRAIHLASQEIAPRLPDEVRRIVIELMSEAAAVEPAEAG